MAYKYTDFGNLTTLKSFVIEPEVQKEGEKLKREARRNREKNKVRRTIEF